MICNIQLMLAEKIAFYTLGEIIIAYLRLSLCFIAGMGCGDSLINKEKFLL